ncbi:MAG: hypothetical protein JWR87_142 [Segetibacter sp.]|jgi:hypothetical protein|nr:hypothetical protein [Segetibacter sp.]
MVIMLVRKANREIALANVKAFGILVILVVSRLLLATLYLHFKLALSLKSGTATYIF